MESISKDKKIRCIFLNCFLRIPNWLFFDKQNIRIPQIINALVDHRPHIIGFSEIFGEKHMNNMKEKLKSRGYKLVAPSSKSITNSGLAIAVKEKRFSIISTTFIPFNYTTFPDILAEKGFFMSNLFDKKSKKNVTIIVTHFQASYTSTIFDLKLFEKIQIKQLFQLTQYILRLRKGSQYIILGDFNIDIFSETLSAYIFKHLFPQVLLKNTSVTICDGTQQTLDYILSSLKMNKVKSITKPIVSDHYFIKGDLYY